MKAGMRIFVAVLCAAMWGSVAQAEYDVQSSLSYVDEVTKITKVLSRSGGRSFGQIAMWIESAADRIDRLSSEGVSEDAVLFGIDVSTRLRNIALAYRDIGMRASVAGPSYRRVGGYTYFRSFYRFYYSYWFRYNRVNYARRVAARDAVRFKYEQKAEILAAAAQLRLKLRG